MSKVYTRTGDSGTTSLVGGKRVSKDCDRLESYGTIDELNAQVGLLLTYVTDQAERECLIGIQNNLFVVGAQLATEAGQVHVLSHTITEDDVAALEKNIDRASDGLPKWRGFTLPGGCRAAAHAHVCRTVCRRAGVDLKHFRTSPPVSPCIRQSAERLFLCSGPQIELFARNRRNFMAKMIVV